MQIYITDTPNLGDQSMMTCPQGMNVKICLLPHLGAVDSPNCSEDEFHLASILMKD